MKIKDIILSIVVIAIIIGMIWADSTGQLLTIVLIIATAYIIIKTNICDSKAGEIIQGFSIFFIIISAVLFYDKLLSWADGNIFYIIISVILYFVLILGLGICVKKGFIKKTK